MLPTFNRTLFDGHAEAATPGISCLAPDSKHRHTVKEMEKGKVGDDKGQGRAGLGVIHNIPESFRAFCRMVSLTAANTSRIFVVSVACVRLASVSSLPRHAGRGQHTEDID